MKQETMQALYETAYNREKCQIGIVHLGYGAFHRAHQAVYIDDYMQATDDLNWGIAAVNLRSSESSDFLEVQKAEGGYLLKTTAPDGERMYRRVRPHLEFADWAKDAEAAEALVARAGVHAITITVTESGYYLDDADALNIDDPLITAEIAGEARGSVYAYLANALARRAEALDQPISILCCDNIRANGKMLSRNFLAYLEATGRENLAAWVRKNATFPCSMVDRITPRASDELLDEVATCFPGQELAPIHGETFIQWVLEDNFAGPMADLTRAGVDIVTDVDL